MTFDLNDFKLLSLLEIFDSYSLSDIEVQVYMCHVLRYFMTHDVIKLKGFPSLPDVMLLFQPEYKFTFSCFQNFPLSIGGY